MTENGQQSGPEVGRKLLAQGTYVILGGSSVRLKFDNRALITLEREWGSLAAFAEELSKGEKGKLFTAISSAIAAGAKGLPQGIDPIDLMELGRIEEYANAVTSAFNEAMPLGAQAGEPTAAPLTGLVSSTSASSSAAWRPPTSES